MTNRETTLSDNSCNSARISAYILLTSEVKMCIRDRNGDPYYNPNLTLRKSNFALRDLKKEKIGEPYRLEGIE